MSLITVYNVFYNDNLNESQDKFLGSFTSENEAFTFLVDYLMENDYDDAASGWVISVQSRSFA